MADLNAKPSADFMTPIDTLLDGVAAVCRLITGVSLVVLTVIFGWLVFGRYVLNATPTWVEQAALLLVMVIAFIGAAVVTFLLVTAGIDVVLGALRGWAPHWLTEGVAALSVLDHFERMTQGLIEVPTLVFFGSLIVIALIVNTSLVDLKKAQ